MPSSSFRRIVAAAILVSSSVYCSVYCSVAQADEISESAQRGAQAMDRGNYDEALGYYSEAYGKGGPKDLLIDIGQVYLRLGQPKDARSACQAYLNLVSSPPPARKAAAEQCLAEAARTPARPRVLPPLPRPTVVETPPPVPVPVPVQDTQPSRPIAQATPVVPPSAPRPSSKPAMPVPAQTRQTTPTRPVPAAAPPPPPPPVAVVAEPPAPLPPPPPVVLEAVPPPVAPLPPVETAPVATPERPNVYSEYERCLHAQRAGDTAGARDCYQRFLPTMLRQGGVSDGDVARVTEQLVRFPEPATVHQAPSRQETPRRNAGLWGAGLTMWLCAMVPTFVFGPLYAQPATGDRKTIYYSLMIPVLGPFISGIWLPVSAKASANDELVTGYTVPWIVADGLAQVAGLTMFAIGVQPRPLPPRLARLLGDVRVMPYAGGQSVGVAGTF